MRLLWSARAWDQYLYWQEQDPRLLLRINALINETRRAPFKGLGKPEPLKGELASFWSRRIDGEHRLVYRVTGSGADQTVEIAQCRFHD